MLIKFDKYFFFILVLYNLIILPIFLILNSLTINPDSVNIYTYSKMVNNGEVFSLPYPPLYPSLVSLYTYFLGIQYVAVFGIVLASIFLVMMSLYINLTDSIRTASIFILIMNSVPFNFFSELFYRTYTFQLVIVVFFALIGFFSIVTQSGLLNQPLYLGITVLGILTTIIYFPTLMLLVLLSYVLTSRKNIFKVFLKLGFYIGFLTLLGAILIFGYGFESFPQFYKLLSSHVDIYVLVNDRNLIQDFFSFKSSSILDVNNPLNIFIFLISIFLISIGILFRKFSEPSSNRFLLTLSYLLIFVTYTGIFEFQVVAGRAIWFLMLVFCVIISKFIIYILIKNMISEKSIIILLTFFLFLNFVTHAILPVKLT
jgi:hypothetical protein